MSVDLFCADCGLEYHRNSNHAYTECLEKQLEDVSSDLELATDERDEANSKIRELKKKIRLVEIENGDLRRRLMELEARNG